MRILADLVADLTTLPALPQMVTRILALVNDPQSQASEVAKLMVREPTLAARVLKLANSPYYGLEHKLNDINRAIVVIGFNTLRTVVVSASMVNAFRIGLPTGFSRANFWKHSIVSAAAARELALRTGIDPELAYSAGLLHDIGKLVMDYYTPNETEKILRKARNESLSFRESEVFTDLSHAFLGGELAQWWNLDAPLRDAIATHHDPENATDKMLFAAVSFANYLSHITGLAAGSFSKPALDRNSWIRLKLKQEDLPELLGMVKNEIKLANAILSVSA